MKNPSNSPVILVLVACTITMLSCKPKNHDPFKEGDIPYYIDVEKYVDNIRPVMLSEIGSSLEYIPLETSPDLMIGSPTAVTLYQNYIIIKDSQQIYLFDTNGKFLRKIGAFGRGPEEYSMLATFNVDKYNNWICVLSNNKILCFDFDGFLVKTIDIGRSFSPLSFSIMDSNKIMLNNTRTQMASRNDDPLYNWFIVDHDGNQISNLRLAPKLANNLPFSTFIFNLYTQNDIVHYMDPFADSLFYWTGESEKLYAHFNLGSRGMNIMEVTDEDLKDDGDIENNKSLIHVSYVIEDDYFMYIWLGFGFMRDQLCVFDKKTNELILLDNNLFKNNLDGGLDFWPKSICEDNTLIGYEDAVTIENHTNGMEPFEKSRSYKGDDIQLEDLKAIIDENSNPVIILLKR
jgi:hypothetical protein